MQSHVDQAVWRLIGLAISCSFLLLVPNQRYYDNDHDSLVLANKASLQPCLCRARRAS
ncbi:hypothetical protein K504DRAFT_465323 [Pleomassaria siparia CBS 279.74]|uniref:Uncharacterized protein n=1 Tax=Pleomassaria siparia CBS 279.74 TaxID=1314801 RepID=A0A6G1KFG3_9PLEO|nr:hypothetical protein K504DRAFT_465323 [Pleomassaria siparia CBS 279.74]